MRTDCYIWCFLFRSNLKLTEKLEEKLKKKQKTFCVLNYLSCQLDVSSPSNIDTLRYIPLTNKDILLQNHHNQEIKWNSTTIQSSVPFQVSLIDPTMSFVTKGSYSDSCLAFSCHISLVSFNREEFFSFLLIFMAFWR